LVRTTVDIDPDVAAKLRQTAQERGITFKEALNLALRVGLTGQSRAARSYRVRPRRLGLRPGIELDKALRLAAALEDEELVRKLELRK
jgi:hypothetical protein